MKTYVISDIHGCNKTFNALLDKIGLNTDDNLYLLGDYIDKGVNSSGVIDTILRLKEKSYNVFPLRGNHEENILNAEKEYDKPTFIHFVKKMNRSGDLLNNEERLNPEYKAFFESLPYYYEVENYILVHAGLNLFVSDPFQDTISMIETREGRKGNEIEKNPVIRNRGIIHGHIPFALDEIKDSIEKNKPIIPLDNGCVYTRKHKLYDYTKLGNLLCLELANLELSVQINIDY